MKLITFDTAAGERHVGALLAGETALVDFTAASRAPHFRNMLALIDGGAAALDEARSLLSKSSATTALRDVKLCAALPDPRQMRDFFSFEKHLRQARVNRRLAGGPASEVTDPAKVEIPKVWFEQPLYYKCNHMNVIGTDTDVQWPSYANILDYELEFGMIIGKRGKNVPRDKAAQHIFGFLIFNDISARDAQYREMPGQLGPAKGKDFDTGNILGPWLVTADEVPDPYNLTMVARINGEEWSRGNSGTMHHRFEDMIVHVSREETIHPGEFFGSGTVGSGCGLELGKFLKPNDVVELEISGLGVLRNRIVRAG